ncbi:MAG TPA: hypothetical protein VFH83_08025, partial [Spirochaetia bacterium]|nr:hypothetical protein [Spirochaetia bacterium]
MDITGNWTDEQGYLPHIRTREPMPVEGTETRFSQTLDLPPGSYRLELLYDPLQDKRPGWSTGTGSFRGFSLNGSRLPLRFVPAPDGRTAAASVGLTVPGGRTELGLRLPNTRPLRTLLHPAQAMPTSGRFLAVRGGGGNGETVICHGVPFLMRRLDIRHIPPFIRHRDRVVEDRGSLAPWSAGVRFDCGGARPRLAHFLGMIHNLDIANGSWYSPKGDHGYSHFVGDRAGEIVIRWDDVGETRIPLVFGYNLWYGKAWDNLWHYLDYAPGRGGANFDATLFDGHDEHRRAIEAGLALADGYRLMGSDSCNARFIFTVDLGGRSVRSIDVAAVPELYDYPLISAITFETTGDAGSPPAALAAVPDLVGGATGLRPVTLDSIERETWRAGVEGIQRVLYTFVDDLPRLQAPSKPDDYFGPTYDFRGSQIATYAATYLYWNGPECSAYIADDGTGCSSSTADLALVHYTQGMGAWYQRRSLFGSIENWLRLYREREPGGLPGSGEA